MINDDLLKKITNILTILLVCVIGYFTPEVGAYGKLDLVSGMFAGMLLYFFLSIPVMITVYIGALVVEVIKVFIDIVKRSCPQGQESIPPAHQ